MYQVVKKENIMLLSLRGVRNLVRTEVPAQPVYAEVDGINMERALINLVSNAIEASGRGQKVKVGMVLVKGILAITINSA